MAVKTFEDTLDLFINSSFFSIPLCFFLLSLGYRVVFWFYHYLNGDSREPEVQENEITYYTLYDDEIKQLMKKYDDMDKQEDE